MSSLPICRLAVWLLLLVLSLPASGRPKTDKLFLKNGDQITCEIIKLENNRLTIKTDYSKGTFIVDFSKVERVASQQWFVVETSKGKYLTGPMRTRVEDSGTIRVGTEAADENKVARKEMIEVRQYEQTWQNRSKFTIDYGFTYTRSNTQTQSNLGTTYNYSSDRNAFSATVESLLVSQENAPNTSRQQGEFNWARRLRQSRTSAGLIGSYLSNNAQDLDLRTSVGAGVGHRFVSNNTSRLSGTAGLVYTNEKYSPTGSNPGRFSTMEAALNGDYRLLSFDSTELQASVWVYPGLTDIGRVRVNTNVDVYLDLVGNLYFRLGIFNNFDSRPPLNTLRNDVGFSTSIGWKFP